MKTKPRAKLGDAKNKVLLALENPKWRYRTASGIANEAHLDAKTVEEVLRNNPDLVRVSIAKSSNGSTLFASKKKISAVSDIWTAFKAVNKVRYG
jgi:hypothetical protein